MCRRGLWSLMWSISQPLGLSMGSARRRARPWHHSSVLVMSLAQPRTINIDILWRCRQYLVRTDETRREACSCRRLVRSKLRTEAVASSAPTATYFDKLVNSVSFVAPLATRMTHWHKHSLRLSVCRSCCFTFKRDQRRSVASIVLVTR